MHLDLHVKYINTIGIYKKSFSTCCCARNHLIRISFILSTVLSNQHKKVWFEDISSECHLCPVGHPEIQFCSLLVKLHFNVHNFLYK